MWPLIFAGAAGLIALLSQSKKQSSGKKSYEDGLKDGEASVKKKQDDERKEEQRINRLVEKRLGENERYSSHRSRFRSGRVVVDEPADEKPAEPKAGEEK